MTRGILVVTHAHELAQGIEQSVLEITKEVPVLCVGGLTDETIDTQFDYILTACEEHKAEELFAFYDLRSVKMHMSSIEAMTTKKIRFYDVALIEGVYTATALLSAGVSTENIEKQLNRLRIK